MNFPITGLLALSLTSHAEDNALPELADNVPHAMLLSPVGETTEAAITVPITPDGCQARVTLQATYKTCQQARLSGISRALQASPRADSDHHLAEMFTFDGDIYDSNGALSCSLLCDESAQTARWFVEISEGGFADAFTCTISEDVALSVSFEAGAPLIDASGVVWLTDLSHGELKLSDALEPTGVIAGNNLCPAGQPSR